MVSTKEITGRTVAIVGASTTIKGKGLGNVIDSYDYVVRFNGAIGLLNNEKYIRDYGQRDDIHFFTNTFINTMKPALNQIKNKPFFLFKKPYSQYENLRYETIGKSFKEVEQQMGKGFSYSGIAVLNYLLKQKPQKIYLYGMNMYIEQPNYYDGDWSNYPEGYIPERMKQLTDELHSDGHLSHSRYWNAVVLKRLLLKYEKVIEYNDSLLKNIDYIIQHRGEFE